LSFRFLSDTELTKSTMSYLFLLYDFYTSYEHVPVQKQVDGAIFGCDIFDSPGHC